MKLSPFTKMSSPIFKRVDEIKLAFLRLNVMCRSLTYGAGDVNLSSQALVEVQTFQA